LSHAYAGVVIEFKLEVFGYFDEDFVEVEVVVEDSDKSKQKSTNDINDEGVARFGEAAGSFAFSFEEICVILDRS